MYDTALFLNGSQTLSIGAASARATLTNSRAVRLVSSVDCFFRFGTSGSLAATTSSHFLPANCPEYFAVRPSLGDVASYVAAITSGTSGTLYISDAG